MPFPVLLALLLLGSLAHPGNLLALAGGAAAGAGLGVYGLRLTIFEESSNGLFYTPNAHLGIALSLLMLGRIAYRFVQIYLMDGTAGMSSTDFMRSPLTLLIFGTLAGYYLTYAIGLLRWHRRIKSRGAPATADRPVA